MPGKPHTDREARSLVKLVVLAFLIGAAFQLGLSLGSLVAPRHEVIEIRTTVDQGAPAPSRHEF